jgi:hypothetical protein
VNTEHSQINVRAKASMALLKQYALCENNVFDCSDPSLWQGHFEEISALDIKPAHVNPQHQIHSLLKARSKLNLRLNIAERILERLKDQASD